MAMTRIIALLAVLLFTTARAQTPTEWWTDSIEPTTPFESIEAGIRFKIPAGAADARRNNPDEVARFTGGAGGWTITLSRFLLDESWPMINQTDGERALAFSGGFFGMVAEQMPNDAPGEFLRSELLPIAGVEGGFLAARSGAGDAKRLQQRAVIRRTDRMFYVVSMSSSLTRPDDLENDPAAQAAVERFELLTNSIELLDQTELRADQDDRLFRTRSLLVNWTAARLRETAGVERWHLLRREGRVVGYRHMRSELADDLPREGKPPLSNPDEPPGLRVGTRLVVVDAEGAVRDTESWAWVSLDRRNESFQLGTVQTDAKGNSVRASEAGQSSRAERTVPVVVREPGEVRPRVESQRRDVYELNVVFSGRAGDAPFTQPLPPYYLPRALLTSLPRLLPLTETKGYLFAVYVPERRAVMTYYVDVLAPEDRQIGMRREVVIPVRERIGLTGPALTHFMTPAGDYLGGMDEASGIAIELSDAETVRASFPDAGLNVTDTTGD
jgi:hypothetical protein